MAELRENVEFAGDSPLEGDGFLWRTRQGARQRHPRPGEEQNPRCRVGDGARRDIVEDDRGGVGIGEAIVQLPGLDPPVERRQTAVPSAMAGTRRRTAPAGEPTICRAPPRRNRTCMTMHPKRPDGLRFHRPAPDGCQSLHRHIREGRTASRQRVLVLDALQQRPLLCAERAQSVFTRGPRASR
jgi:hypothetical protein